jgi:hypothetical protein
VSGETTFNGAGWTLTIDESNGDYTFTQTEAFQHLSDNDPNTVASGKVTVSVADSDDATRTVVTLDLSISDDGPTLAPETMYLENVGSPVTATVDLNFDVGADGLGSVLFNEPVSVGMTLVDAVDTNSGNPLTLGGEKLYLFYGTDQSVLEAWTVETDANGDPVFMGGEEAEKAEMGFSITLDPATGTGEFTYMAGDIISNNTSKEATDLTGVGGGNVPWKALIDLGGNTEPGNDVLMSTKAGETVNTNATQIGVSDGNSITTGEYVRFDFLDALAADKVKNTWYFDADGDPITNGTTMNDPDGPHVDTGVYRQRIAFVSGGTANVTLTALIVGDGENILNDMDLSLVDLSVDHITVVDADNGDQTETVNIVENVDGSITIFGMQLGWEFIVNTTNSTGIGGEGANDNLFNAIKVEGAGDDPDPDLDGEFGAGEFKLGSFSYGEESFGVPIQLNYALQGMDTDGDTVTGGLEVNLYPEKSTISAATDGELLEGGGKLLEGSALDDNILGGDNDDILIGGGGDDILVGGDGKDTFVFRGEDAGTTTTPAVDTVKDFSVDDVDVLDISDLLADGSANLESLETYLNVNTSTNEDGRVDSTIDVTIGSVKQTIVVEGVDLVDLGGGGVQADIISNLVDGGYLKVEEIG